MESYILAFSQSIPHTKSGIICVKLSDTIMQYCVYCGDHYNQGKCKLHGNGLYTRFCSDSVGMQRTYEVDTRYCTDKSYLRRHTRFWNSQKIIFPLSRKNAVLTEDASLCLLSIYAKKKIFLKILSHTRVCTDTDGIGGLTLPAKGFPWDDLREIFSGCQWKPRYIMPLKYCRKFEPSE